MTKIVYGGLAPRRRFGISPSIFLLLVIAAAGGAFYFYSLQQGIALQEARLSRLSIEVLPHRAGKVDRVFVTVGQLVEAGAPLFVFEASAQRAALEEARAALQHREGALPQAYVQAQQNGPRGQARLMSRLEEAQQQERALMERVADLSVQVSQAKLAMSRQGVDTSKGAVEKAYAAATDALLRARVDLENASGTRAALERDLQRMKDEVDSISMRSGVSLEYWVKLYEAQLAKVEAAQQELESATVCSPVKGEILTLAVAPGMQVEAEKVVATILVDDPAVYAEGMLPAAQAGKIVIGMPCKIVAESGASLEAKVVSMERADGAEQKEQSTSEVGMYKVLVRAVNISAEGIQMSPEWSVHGEPVAVTFE